MRVDPSLAGRPAVNQCWRPEAVAGRTSWLIEGLKAGRSLACGAATAEGDHLVLLLLLGCGQCEQDEDGEGDSEKDDEIGEWVVG